MKHPQFLKNQVSQRGAHSVQSMPWMSIPTILLFLLEVRGYSSRLYDDAGGFPYGWFQLAASVLSFLFFTDMLISTGVLEAFIIGTFIALTQTSSCLEDLTPFVSHAFHPLNDFLQSLPYHIYPFYLPLHQVVYLSLYILVNIWTISIHDGDFPCSPALGSLLMARLITQTTICSLTIIIDKYFTL